MPPEIKYKKYKCKRCGFVKEIDTNHYGECYSLGHFNACPQCPPYAKYPEFGGSTTWICLEKPPGVEKMDWEQLSKRLRKPVSSEEVAFKDRAYKLGMANGWCNGQFAMSDGNFIVEDDRLNKNSFSVADDLETLEAFFEHGNWCLGSGMIYKNLCFINQVNGGDEWLTIKNFEDEAIDFESITFKGTIAEGEFEPLIERLLKADKEACKKLND